MIKQRTKEWHKQREGRITGSVAGALLGLSPYMSQVKAIKELKNPTEPEKFLKDTIFRYGIEMEPHAIEMLALETGMSVKECGFYPYSNWLGASPDGIMVTDDGFQSALCEIKCPWGLRDEEDPQFKSAWDQPHYYAQMQIEMLCADFDHVYFYQYANGKGKLEIVYIDGDWIDKNLPKLHEIWEIQIKGKSEWSDKTNRYFKIDQQIKDLTAEKKDLMDEFKDYLKDEPGVIGNAVLKKSKRKGSVDYKAAFKEYDIDEESYRKKDTEVWTIKSA